LFLFSFKFPFKTYTQDTSFFSSFRYIPQEGKYWPDPSLPDMGNKKSIHPLEAPGAESKSATAQVSTLGGMLSRSNSTRSKKSSKYVVEGKNGDRDDRDDTETRGTGGSLLRNKTKMCVLL
jgi:hypothetical protein